MNYLLYKILKEHRRAEIALQKKQFKQDKRNSEIKARLKELAQPCYTFI